MAYNDLFTVALFIFIYSLFASRIEKFTISGPIIALIFGLVTGPFLMDFFKINIGSEGYKTLAELALALVLFTDASKTNLKQLEHSIKTPSRLLLIGLPLTIVFGLIASVMLFNGFSWIEAGILATMLAPTDAALGKAVVTNPSVPTKIREALNVESGLNDGICVPVLFLFIALFQAVSIKDISILYGLGIFAKEIGIGLAAGLAIVTVGDKLSHLASERNWISDSWKPIVIIALVLCCFSLTQIIGGSGFIACFSAGVLYGTYHKKHKLRLLEAAEGAGDTLSLVTWIIFGALVITAYIPDFNIDVIVYAVLSLTVIRIIPVFISLINSGFSIKEKLFIGWFGPRGLASVVFAIIAIGIDFPHKDTIVLTVVCTILLSVILHGFTANPFIKILQKTEAKQR